jgi:peroxiredoxin
LAFGRLPERREFAPSVSSLEQTPMVPHPNRRTFLAAATLTALSVPAVVAAQAPFGPRVGTKAPDAGALADQAGQMRRLANLAGPKGTVLVFYRSAGWCPYCQVQLIALNDGLPEIEKRGYKLVGLSYDQPSVAKTFTDRQSIRFVLLSDIKSEAIGRWGLRDPQYAAGSRAHGVPRPAIFVIDRQGVVRASLAEEAYQKRPPIGEVLKALDALP